MDDALMRFFDAEIQELVDKARSNV